jgi:hypothetical protein
LPARPRAARPPNGRSGSIGIGFFNVLRLVRFALLVVLTFLVLGLIVAVARPETGEVEKVLLVAATAGLLFLAVPVRRIGAHP